MADRDSKGRFIKGNKVNKGSWRPAEINSMKSDIKVEVVKSAHNLLKPWDTLDEDLRKPESSRLDYFVGQALKNGNAKFIQWLLEMAIGKPKQTMDIESKIIPTIIKRLNGEVEELGVEEK